MHWSPPVSGAFETCRAALEDTSGGGGATAGIVVNSATNLATTCYQTSIPKRTHGCNIPLMYWWLAEITDLRKEYHKLRHLAQRLQAGR